MKTSKSIKITFKKDSEKWYLNYSYHSSNCIVYIGNKKMGNVQRN